MRNADGIARLTGPRSACACSDPLENALKGWDLQLRTSPRFNCTTEPQIYQIELLYLAIQWLLRL